MMLTTFLVLWLITDYRHQYRQSDGGILNDGAYTAITNGTFRLASLTSPVNGSVPA